MVACIAMVAEVVLPDMKSVTGHHGKDTIVVVARAPGIGAGQPCMMGTLGRTISMLFSAANFGLCTG